MKNFFLIIFCLLFQYSFSESKKDDPNFSFSLMPQITKIDISPIKELAQNEKSLEDYRFKMNDNIFFIHGLGLNWVTNEMVNIGFGLWGGFKTYTSSPSSFVLKDSVGNILTDSLGNDLIVDSTSNLMAMPFYAGFYVDKIKKISCINIHGGITFGAGALLVIKYTEESENESAFYNTNDSRFEDKDENDIEIAAAPMVIFDIHGGLSYSVTDWMHIGSELSAGVFSSSHGFSLKSDSFFSINKSIKFKLVFGSIA